MQVAGVPCPLTQNGDVDVTKALLRRGAQHSLPNRADDMPIHVACRHCLPPVDPLDCVTGEPLKCASPPPV